MVGCPSVTMSDRDKGLSPSLPVVFPSIPHTNCALHIARNCGLGVEQGIATSLAKSVSEDQYNRRVQKLMTDEKKKKLPALKVCE